MRKLLIAETDAALCGGLVDLLRRSYDITTCTDGGTASELLRSLRPDALILNLMLPVKDGSYIPEEGHDVLPPVTLCISDFSNDYMTQTARDLGVHYMVIKPCLPRVIVSRLEHLIHHLPAPHHSDGQSKAAKLPLQFHLNPKNDGFRFLKIAIPLYAQDPQQRICKELYAAIASICGAGNWNQVERSIRTAIDAAWQLHSKAWAQYFLGTQNAPTGKTFISRLAQLLMDGETDIS